MDQAQHPTFPAANSEWTPAAPYNGQSANNVRPTAYTNLAQRHQFNGLFLSWFCRGINYLSRYCKLTANGKMRACKFRVSGFRVWDKVRVSVGEGVYKPRTGRIGRTGQFLKHAPAYRPHWT